jgi:BirA family biotin operon repressor/biotin-[acetyl-CoA-carboxylase] ligase
MDRLYSALPQADVIFSQWKNRLLTLGQKVQIISGDLCYKGTAESVTRDGSLMLRQADGSLVRIVAGDVNLG